MLEEGHNQGTIAYNTLSNAFIEKYVVVSVIFTHKNDFLNVSEMLSKVGEGGGLIP